MAKYTKNNDGRATGPVSPAEKRAEEANPPAKAETPAEIDPIDALQLVLDLAGMIPGAGAVPDLLNAAISLMRGDVVGALFSAGAAIPAVGDAAGAAKILKNADKYAQAIKTIETKVLPKLPDGMRKKLEEYLAAIRKKIDELTKKEKPKEKAESKDDDGAKSKGEKKADPCKVLEDGVPGDGYRGGKHGKIKEGGYGYDPKRESHHMPADATYSSMDGKSISTDSKPAIQMDKADHHKTASWGSSASAKAYRDTQAALMRSGKSGFIQAVMMDVVDIRSQFGDKYDAAIAQYLAWAKCKGYM